MTDKPLWDAFRSKPRVIREAGPKTNWFLYVLYCLKFAIYIIVQTFVLASVFVSKAAVLLLATNLRARYSAGDDRFHHRCQSNNASRKPFHETDYVMYLSLLLIQIVPDLTAMVLSMGRILFRVNKDYSICIQVIFLETLRVAGLSTIIFIVFPLVDIVRCALLMCGVVFFPQFVKVCHQLIQSLNRSLRLRTRLKILASNIARTVICSLVCTSAYFWLVSDVQFRHYIALPLGMLCYGIGNWEAWIHAHHAGGIFDELFQVKYGFRKLGGLCRIIVSLFRIGAILGIIGCSVYIRHLPIDGLLKLSLSNIHQESYNILYLAMGVIVINFLVRVSIRFLAAMNMRLLHFLHPAFIMTPVMVILPLLSCHFIPICAINSALKVFGINLHCSRWDSGDYPFPDYYLTVIWFLSFCYWSYNFVAGKEFRRSEDVIDYMPSLLTGLSIDTSVVLFRIAIGKKEIPEEFDDEEGTGYLRIVNSEIDKTSTLYVCATMWHETKNEMTQMIKSLLKLDAEQAVRMAEKNQKDLIRFKFEVHIFFDDAWTNDSECGRIPNEYFKLLFELLMDLTMSPDDATSADSKTRILINTSYGGRLVLRLPAGTLMFVHLKDKQLIRHKKRWSQVMYMYYLLGHRIMDSHVSVEDRQLQADNTYILAIDGDSKFEPDSVIKLLHLMNTKSDIGCACGRIHPIGNGVMVWYQKFEYAIAHWFQKAAEHVFGCVLCAPGCFSLFRASALMDDNIMHKYTTTAFEPRHFVQYDQGEDRWLSTLMLKQGYRIEYAAAADAETYAPEGFEEFFNQRRRWTPSSVANTIDLLADYKLASQNNASISKLYILYQMLVIGFSLLGPAIIFTMLVYAQVAAFSMDSTDVLLYNAIPVCLFIFSCFAFDSSIQLMYAKVSSIVYAFIMLAVLVATTQQIVLETIFSPTSMFVMMMVFIFLFASFIHPKEFSNILFGSIFFLMIPSTYVFLSLYSLINLNVINWGTREAVAKAIGRPVDKESVGEKWIRRVGLDDENSSWYKILPWLRSSEPANAKGYRALERKVERTERMLKTLQQNNGLDNGLEAVSMLNTIAEDDRKKRSKHQDIVPLRNLNVGDTQTGIDPTALIHARRGLWMDCEYLQCCDRGKLKQSEERFWDQLIDKYLRPIESTPKEQSAIAEGLVSLRNRIAFSIIILNGLLVLAIFLLQRHKDVLSIQLVPYEGFVWTKMNETTGRFEKTTEALKVDPLGMGIIFFLLGILIIQTIGMVIHRLNTLVEALHEISETDDVHFESPKLRSRTAVLDEARQMIDTMHYGDAHGADGYVREGKMAQKVLNNVLYKLQQDD